MILLIIFACIIPAVLLEQAVIRIIEINNKKVSDKKGDVIIFRRFYEN